jgi:adenylosuccinate synthase
VTQRLRRVARFDPEIVRRAIAANLPTLTVLNHIDYVDASCAQTGNLTDKARTFVRDVSTSIGAPIDLVGIGPSKLVDLTLRAATLAS